MFARRFQRELSGEDVHERFTIRPSLIRFPDPPGANVRCSCTKFAPMAGEVSTRISTLLHSGEPRDRIPFDGEHRISLPDARAGMDELVGCPHELKGSESRKFINRTFGLDKQIDDLKLLDVHQTFVRELQ